MADSVELLAMDHGSIMWDFSSLADRIGKTLADAEAALRLEQAVYGLDAQDELALQALLGESLAKDYSVAREVHYPSTAGRKKSHRPRCDIVVSEMGSPLRRDTEPPGLFDPVRQCELADALWLEVKVAYQFREGGRRHGGYGAQWRQAIVNDLLKIEAETNIRHAGLVLIVFNENAGILGKDLELFEDVLAIRQVLAGFRQVRSVPILDRIGHTICTAAVWPTLQR